MFYFIFFQGCCEYKLCVNQMIPPDNQRCVFMDASGSSRWLGDLLSLSVLLISSLWCAAL